MEYFFISRENVLKPIFGNLNYWKWLSTFGSIVHYYILIFAQLIEYEKKGNIEQPASQIMIYRILRL